MELLAELHPKIIHFPIAFLMVYPILELIAYLSKKEFFSKAAILFLLIGVFAAVLAVLTGNQAFISISNMSENTEEIFTLHETYASLTMWFFSVVLVLRYYLTTKKRFTPKLHLIFVIASVIGLYFVYQAGNYGGKLSQSKIYDSVKEIKSSTSE